jgi:hypothetical protein
MAARTGGLRLDTCLSQVLEAAKDELCPVAYPEGFSPPTRKDGCILQEDRIVLLTLERASVLYENLSSSAIGWRGSGRCGLILTERTQQTSFASGQITRPVPAADSPSAQVEQCRASAALDGALAAF